MEGNFQFEKQISFEDHAIIDTGSNVHIISESCRSQTMSTELFATGPPLLPPPLFFACLCVCAVEGV